MITAQKIEWISIEESLPPESEFVLVWNGKEMYIDSLESCYNHFDDFMGKNFELDDVTHWHFLPKPPKEN